MVDLVISPQTKALIDHLSLDLPQSLLISGQTGVGLATAARRLAGSGLMAVIEPTNVKEQVDSNGTISVEAVRKLYEQTRGKYGSRQIVIIDDADRMNTSGQSAFLKLLEEPNNNIHFILTSHQPSRLKSTILSRVQHHVIQPISDEQTSQLLDELAVEAGTKQAQIKFMASGLPAEITRLVSHEQYFNERVSSMGDARSFLQATAYDRLLIVQKYYSSRDKSLQLIADSIRISRRSLSAKPQPGLVKQLAGLLKTKERLESNGNVRLCLTSFVL